MFHFMFLVSVHITNIGREVYHEVRSMLIWKPGVFLSLGLTQYKYLLRRTLVGAYQSLCTVNAIG